MKKKIVPFILSIILLQSICMPIYAASTSELNEQKADIQQKKEETEKKQDEVQEEISTQRKEIASLDESISEIEGELQTIGGQISTLETSIDEKTKELEKKQEEYKENDALLRERLVVMYEAGETSFLDILFGSSNLVEFISNYYTLSQLTQCDSELLQSIEQEQKEIETTKNALEKEKAEVVTLKNDKEAKNNTLKNKKTEREEKVSALSEQDKQLQSEIDSYEAQVKKIDNDIAKILEDLKKKEEEAKKNNNSSGNTSGGSSGTAGLKFDGSFIWPCNSKIITSTVKKRWGRWHKGLDIGASYENVYASASGYAYNLENPGGYGHYIMIVHGDGYITLYGHLNSYNISYGQYVKQGQVIAQSGNSGASQGAHLHFEIRKASNLSNYFSSSFLNPLDYLPGGYTFAAGAKTES